MKWYRFTLAFDGEPQGIGFLHGLSEVGLRITLDGTISKMLTYFLVVPFFEAKQK